MSCDHIGILTKDAESLERFYCDKLGFQKEKETVLSGPITKTLFDVDCDVTFVRVFQDDFKLEIFQPEEDVKFDRGKVGFHHFGLVVGDKDQFLKEMGERGVPIIEIKRNDHSVYFIKDPDGNLIEVRSA